MQVQVQVTNPQVQVQVQVTDPQVQVQVQFHIPVVRAHCDAASACNFVNEYNMFEHLSLIAQCNKWLLLQLK